MRCESDSQKVDLKISTSRSNEKQFFFEKCEICSQQTLIYSELTEQYKHLCGIPVKSYENIKLKIIIGLNNKNVAMPL